MYVRDIYDFQINKAYPKQKYEDLLMNLPDKLKKWER